ncbi:MAG: hypothetical protein Q9162_006530 [Coniocarpon cinnabarinum]
MATFGSPGGQSTFSKPSPPERGSFPLDHDGECKQQMSLYLSCLKRTRGVNQEECRELSKSYLQCRMDRNLMAKDEMRNLGFDKVGANEGAGQPRQDQNEELKTVAEETRREKSV